MNKILITLILGVVVHSFSFGKILNVKVVDKESKIPLPAVLHVESDSVVIVNSNCDKDGCFQVSVPDSISEFLLEISYEGFFPLIINLTNNLGLNLGTVSLEKIPKTLQEVTVIANNTSVSAGKRTIFPTLHQIKRNYNSMQLLSDLQSISPELKVNQDSHTITIDGNTPIFQINGRRQYVDRLITLSPERIERIEMTTYRDPQYDAPVFNIILKPVSRGGTISIQSENAVTTPKTYTVANGTFNYKKSEFMFDYKLVYRNSKKEISNVEESYLGPDFQVMRDGRGLPSSTIDQDHRFLLEYTYTPGKNSILVFSGEATLHRHNNNYKMLYTQTSDKDNLDTEFESWYKRHNWRTPFSFGAFYRIQKTIHNIEVSTSISHANGEYNSEQSYSNGYSSTSYSKNEGMSYSANANYYLRLPENMNFTAGAEYLYSLAESDLYQSNYPSDKSRMHSNQISFYGKLSWSHRGFSVAGGPGLKSFSSVSGNVHEDYWRWRGSLALAQNIGRSASVSYSATLTPSFPSLGQTSTVLQTVNDYSARIGNPGLKSFLGIDQNLRFNYRYKKMRISPYAYYYYIDSPILESWNYSEADKLFIQTYENGNNSHTLTAALNLSFSNLLGKINLSVDAGYNCFWLNMKEFASYSKGHLFCEVNASAYIGKFYFSINWDPVRGLQHQGSFYTRSTPSNLISVFYRYRGFQFGARWRNPFMSKSNLTQRYRFSKVHPQYDEYYIKDFNNLILLSVQYNVSFGKSYNKQYINTRKVSVKDIITAE